MVNVKHRVSFVFVCFAIVIIPCTKQSVPEFTDMETLIKRYQMECIEETRVDPDYISMIKKRSWNFPQGRRPYTRRRANKKNDKLKAKTQLVKDWALCAMMKAGLMTPQGVYKIDTALARVPDYDRDTVEKLIDTCLSTKAIPAKDIAYNFIKCYQKARGNYTVSVL